MDNQPIYGTIRGVLANIRLLSFHDNEKNKDVPYVEVEMDNPTGYGRTNRYIYLSMSVENYHAFGYDKAETLDKVKSKFVTANVLFDSRQGSLKVTVVSAFTATKE